MNDNRPGHAAYANLPAETQAFVEGLRAGDIRDIQDAVILSKQVKTATTMAKYGISLSAAAVGVGVGITTILSFFGIKR